MTPEQIRVALKKTEGEIIGLRKSGRRQYGGQPNPSWPAGHLDRMQILKEQAKQYRRLLEPMKDGTDEIPDPRSRA